jgi:hypothetical protein
MNVLTSEIEYALVQSRGDPGAAGQLLLEVMSGPKFGPEVFKKRDAERRKQLEQSQQFTRGSGSGTKPLMRLVGMQIGQRIMQQGGARTELQRMGGSQTEGFGVVMRSIRLDAFVALAKEAELSDAAVYILYRDNVVGKQLGRYPHFFPLATHVYGEATDQILTLEDIEMILKANQNIQWHFKFFTDWVYSGERAVVLFWGTYSTAIDADIELLLNGNLETDVMSVILEAQKQRIRMQTGVEVHWNPRAGGAFVRVWTENSSLVDVEGVIVKPGENFGDAVERCLVPIEKHPYTENIIKINCVLFDRAWHHPVLFESTSKEERYDASMELHEIGNVQEAKEVVTEWCIGNDHSAMALTETGAFSNLAEFKTFFVDYAPLNADFAENWLDTLLDKYMLDYEAWPDDLRKKYDTTTYDGLLPRAQALKAAIYEDPEEDLDLFFDERSRRERAVDFWIEESRLSKEDVTQLEDLQQMRDWYAFFSLPVSDPRQAQLAVQYYRKYYPEWEDYQSWIPKYLEYRQELTREEPSQPTRLTDYYPIPPRLSPEDYQRYLESEGVV